LQFFIKKQQIALARGLSTMYQTTASLNKKA